MKISGVIHQVELHTKVIGIKQNKKIYYFYFQNSQMNLFKRYLDKGNWIDLEYYKEWNLKKRNKEALVFSFIYKLYSIGKYEQVIYYDKTALNQSLSKFLKTLGNIMVLDLEMTMPSYNFKGKGFTPEIIQAGFIVFDGEGEEICRYSNYIRPTLTNRLSKRVEDFLNISDEEFTFKAISYEAFYNDFSEVLDNYHPVIIVYGKNDILVLN